MDPFNSFFSVLLGLLFGCGLLGLVVACCCFWCPVPAPAPAPAPLPDFVINIPPHRFVVIGAHLPPLVPRPYLSPPPTPRTVLHPWS